MVALGVFQNQVVKELFLHPNGQESPEGVKKGGKQLSVRFGVLGLQKLVPLLLPRRAAVCEESLGSPRGSGLSVPIV